MRPPEGDDWLALAADPLPIGMAVDWVVRPDCGAVAAFCGTARDHAGGRSAVEELVYEAYGEQALARLAAVAGEVRARWPMTGRIALLHRTGTVRVGETAVVVAVSTPHRPEAFAASRFAIDAVKASVPIWKKERWDGGEAWGLEGHDVLDPAEISLDAAETSS